MAETGWLDRRHRQARRLFEAYERINRIAARRKELLFFRIRQELEAHAGAVRDVLLAAEDQAGPGSLGETAEKVLEKLNRLAGMLDEIALVGPGEKQFDSKIRMLHEYVSVEVRRDEAALFAAAEQRLGRKRLRGLRERAARTAG
jgi:hypothetical protein